MVRILDEIKDYAHKNNVPIMLDDGIEFLTNYIRENNIKNILEIGSAIGYSAISMALVSDDVHVTTIERDVNRYNEAIKNISKMHLEDRINVILSDAFDVELNDCFDLIFIDAAKAQYIKFFNKFDSNLKSGGVVFSDNLNFHGLTHTNEYIESRNVRGLVRKLNQYIDFLNENKDYNKSFYDIGDGISVSIKK